MRMGMFPVARCLGGLMSLGLGLLVPTHAQEQKVGEMVKVQLTKETEIRFAESQEAERLLVTEDSFLTRMQPLERQIRLGSEEPVTKDAYLEHLKRGVRPWAAEEMQVLMDACQSLTEAFEGYELPFPKTIYFVRVSKEVESDAPHCRGPAIVFPDGFFGKEEDIEKTLAHELFHVLSSHNQELRDQLYRIIGFQRCSEIELPSSLTERRLTNPDAPTYEHYITLDKSGEEVLATPITFTKTSTYEGGGLFQNLEFQLMVLERDGEQLRPKIDEGKPVLISPRQSPDFIKQIGRNTGYIIHPEETLADNFWMLMLDHEVMDRWVIEKMRAILKK